MLAFSAGIAIGFCIKPAMRAYDNYDLYKNFLNYSFKQSIAKAIANIWN